jgi:outer membrane protein assembly factor BamB
MHLRLFPALTLFAILVGAALVAACPPRRHVQYSVNPVVLTRTEEKPAPRAVPVSGDWPMYGGSPSRNMVNTVAKGIPTEWEPKKGGKNIKWIADTGERGYLPPAVAGGKVYLPTNDKKPRDPKPSTKAVLKCFDEATGALLWQNVHDMPPEAIVTMAKPEGLLSTPTVEGDRIYYITPAAVVVCADPKEKGKIVWECDLMKEFKVYPHYVTYGSPLVIGDLVYAVTGNGRAGGDSEKPVPEPKAPSFVAIDKKSGKVVWQDNSPGDKIMEGTWSSPLYAEVKGKGQVIFPGGDGWLYAFTAGREKKLLWKFDCNPKGSKFQLMSVQSANYILTPAVHEELLYVTVGQQEDNGPGIGHVWCVDITKTGDLSEELDKGKPNPNSGLKWHFGGPLPKGSQREWAFGRSISGFAIHDGLVYAVEKEGFLHCLDAKSGKEYWEDDLKGDVWASPLWVDGKVYIPDTAGNVHIYQHGKEKKALPTVDMEANVKAAPVVANGVLYITTDRRLYAIGGK